MEIIGNPMESNTTATRYERQLQLLECLSDGICEVDADGRCTYVSATGAFLLGFEATELIGTSLHEVIHPGGRAVAPAECAICQAVKNAQGLKPGKPARRTHGTFSHKDGRAIPVSYSVVPIAIEGRLQGDVMAFYDDAERQRLAAELRDRTTELAESERRKSEFVATLAHELRNPLAPLRAALQIMRKASDNATTMAQLRTIMERQLGHLVHLLDDLLDIARVSSGQMTLQKERVALQDILQAAVEASEPLRMTTKNALILEVPIEPLHLVVDATRLTQVVTNILNNAAQYSVTGGPITVHVERVESTVRIDIADAGIGIARDALNRIFDMFTRVGHEARSTHAGLGIGLNLARRLVEMHDGQLVASSEGLGKGSHFLITLPLPERTPQESTTDEARRADGEKEKVAPIRALIVDDNVDGAVTLSLLLQLGGHTTAIAHDGLEALKLASEFKPDIVFLDLGLPGMDGYEVARKLRRMPELGRPVLAAVTGWSGAEERLRTKQAGFDEHLTKPVDISIIELLLTALPVRRLGENGTPPAANGHTLDTPH